MGCSLTDNNNNNIPVNESKLIQEAIKINGAPNHEHLHNIQYGSGSTVIPIEKYNQAVESSHLWKNNCEKLEEDNYVKDNAVKIRDAHLQNQNIKLQDEFIKNNNLHADYHNALEKIEQLELINKEICNESDDKIAAMGKDMAKVIRENKQLKRNFFKRRNRALNNYNRWKNMQYGDGVKKKFLKIKSPTILRKDTDVSLAPSTISVFNNGKVQYRGEKTIQKDEISSLVQQMAASFSSKKFLNGYVVFFPGPYRRPPDAKTWKNERDNP